MSRPPAAQDRLVRSYLSLRKSVGFLGTALPLVLAVGGLLLHRDLSTSVSAYYHTGMRDVFVGTLTAIAVFLWSYRGYDERDSRAGNIGALFALGVAYFPVMPLHPTPTQQVAGWLHVVSAAGFFATLAYFCLFLFRLSDEQPPTHRKLMRNRVYEICGYTIVICVIGIGIVSLPPVREALMGLRPVFWLEAGAIVAFGMSWLTKGEAILEDEGAPPPAPRVAPRIPESDSRA